jgi:hypothetical protein
MPKYSESRFEFVERRTHLEIMILFMLTVHSKLTCQRFENLIVKMSKLVKKIFQIYEF